MRFGTWMYICMYVYCMHVFCMSSTFWSCPFKPCFAESNPWGYSIRSSTRSAFKVIFTMNINVKLMLSTERLGVKANLLGVLLYHFNLQHHLSKLFRRHNYHHFKVLSENVLFEVLFQDEI